jgi:hypothetical protein
MMIHPVCDVRRDGAAIVTIIREPAPKGKGDTISASEFLHVGIGIRIGDKFDPFAGGWTKKGASV